MHDDPFPLLDPVFKFFDRIIYDYGDILFMLLVFACIPLIVWILRGGLGRKMGWHRPGTATHIIVIRDKIQPPPLPSETGEESKRRQQSLGGDGSGDSFAA